MDEAISRGCASVNPARRLGLEESAPSEKVAWSDFEVDRVAVALAERSKFGWMHVTFLMGLYQAVRLRQSQIPLSRIDFRRRIIDYPSNRVKGGQGYSQPFEEWEDSYESSSRYILNQRVCHWRMDQSSFRNRRSF